MGTFKPSYEGIGQMLRSPEMVAEMLRRAERGKTAGEAVAPYDPGSHDGTHFKDSFHAEASVKRHLATTRAVGTVYNDDPAAIYIELGTSDTPAFHILGGPVIDAMRD